MVFFKRFSYVFLISGRKSPRQLKGEIQLAPHSGAHVTSFEDELGRLRGATRQAPNGPNTSHLGTLGQPLGNLGCSGDITNINKELPVLLGTLQFLLLVNMTNMID